MTNADASITRATFERTEFILAGGEERRGWRSGGGRAGVARAA
jgi:hypothetical protein